MYQLLMLTFLMTVHTLTGQPQMTDVSLFPKVSLIYPFISMIHFLSFKQGSLLARDFSRVRIYALLQIVNIGIHIVHTMR